MVYDGDTAMRHEMGCDVGVFRRTRVYRTGYKGDTEQGEGDKDQGDHRL